MTTKPPTTPEEKTYWELYEGEELCEATRAIAREAHRVAAEYFLASRVFVCCYPQEIEEAREKMRLAAAGLEDETLEQLTQVARAALAAHGSVDPFGRDAPLGYQEYREDLHLYYGMVVDMVAQTYRSERATRLSNLHKPLAKEGEDELLDMPF